MDTLQATPRRTYYSRAANLIVKISDPVPMMSNGTILHHGGKQVEFKEMGDGWGRYITSDPEEIAVLDRNDLCVDAATYNDMTTPDSVKVQLAREEKTRLMTQNSNLQKELEELRAKAKQPAK